MRPTGLSGARTQGFKPLRGGGLNQFYAMQDRRIPAGYNPYNTVSSAEEIAGMANTDTGRDIGPGGGWIPQRSGMTAPAAPAVATPPAMGGMGYWNQMMNGGAPATAPAALPQSAPAASTFGQPVAGEGAGGFGSGVNSFAERLARARQAVEEGKAMQQMQAVNNPPMVPGSSYQTPYGTASSKIVPRGTSSAFRTGSGLNRDEFFGAAARRQGVDNKFASAPAKPLPRGYQPMTAGQRSAIAQAWRKA